jgi:hypothetical protein
MQELNKDSQLQNYLAHDEGLMQEMRGWMELQGQELCSSAVSLSTATRFF